MSNFFKRKVGLPLVASACIVLASSCSEDFQKWEILQGDVKSEYLGDNAAPLPYGGGSVLMTVETNGDWRVTTPSWISADRTSGTGNAIVRLDVPENNTTKKRNGTVTVDFSASEESNLAGNSKKSYSISQSSLNDAVKIEFPEAYLTVDRTWNNQSHSYNYYVVDCSITYSIEYDESDPRLNEFLANAYLSYSFGETSGYYSFWNLGFYYFDEKIRNIDVARGTHTITSGSSGYHSNDIAPGYVGIYAADRTLLGRANLGKKYIY